MLSAASQGTGPALGWQGNMAVVVLGWVSLGLAAHLMKDKLPAFAGMAWMLVIGSAGRTDAQRF